MEKIDYSFQLNVILEQEKEAYETKQNTRPGDQDECTRAIK